MIGHGGFCEGIKMELNFMKKVICSIIVVAILILLLVFCSVKKSNIDISSVAVNETSERAPTTNTQETMSTGQSGSITVEEIIRDHIPKPFNPKVHSNSLEYGGRWKGNVMPELIKEMKKIGWAELKNEQMGAMLLSFVEKRVVFA